MKKIKKNIFGIALTLAMILGVVLSFVPKSVNADQGGGSSGCDPPDVPCYSASYEADKCDYQKCSPCITIEHRHFDGVNGCCRPTGQ